MNKTQSVSVSGLLIMDGKALIAKRSEKEEAFSGFFELPGGKVDFGEHPDETIIREFKEETNLDVERVALLTIFTYLTKNDTHHTVELVYLLSSKNDAGKVKLSEEHDDVAWISLDQLDEFKITGEVKRNIKLGFEKLNS